MRSSDWSSDVFSSDLLSVTENAAIEPEVQRFIAIHATGFALFTLLVQGTTLSTLIRWLGLDQLSAVDRAFRSQVLTQALSSVRSNLRSFAGRYELADDLVDESIRPYSERLSLVSEENSFSEVLSDRERSEARQGGTEWLQIGSYR